MALDVPGAAALARALSPFTKVRIAEPPHGIKDLRAWFRAGATHQAVANVIESCTTVSVQIGVRS